MPPDTVQEKLDAAESITEVLRSQGNLYEENFPVVPNEKTNWLDEQRAVMTDCALADLSHHMTSVEVEGPDAEDFLNYLCVNNFSECEVGQAKQAVVCSPDGYVWGDGPMLRLSEDHFWGVPVFTGDWVEYLDETGEWDAEIDVELPTSYLDGDPELYIFQVQGPKAMDVLDQLTDANLRDVGFYRFEEIEFAGYPARALGHGMNTEAGFEFHGDFEHSEEVMDAILEAGEAYGIQGLGSRAYLSQSVRLGWLPPAPPPIYTGESLREYREWLPADNRAGNYSISGSYDSGDIEDYYMSPVELGYGRLIDLDHDFVGKEAVEAELENQQRELATLQWDRDDTVDVFGSLFEPGVPEGKNAKWFDNLPRVGWAWGVFDTVLKDGEQVGMSHSRSYEADVHSFVSLAVLDLAYTDPGTEVTVVWGEPGGTSPAPQVEEHTQTEIDAVVGEVPYTEEDHRKTVSTAD